MALIKGGPAARAKVLEWFTDCLAVNPGATAMRPDQTKVSSSGLLLNLSVALLKLCDPFVRDTKKHHLIDPAFVSCSDAGRRLFPRTGDHAIPRLGESASNQEDESSDAMDTSFSAATTTAATTTPTKAATPQEYNPKNAFIPQVFYLTARSLALGIVPMLSSHENLLRHISHQHYELNSNNRDIYSDPHFCMLVSRQRSSEVALFQEEHNIEPTLAFLNLSAKVLVDRMGEPGFLHETPEHLVDNICDVLMSIAKMKSKLLRGADLSSVFSLVVALLSPTYATVRMKDWNVHALGFLDFLI